MRVLVVTNMAPTADGPAFGVFVQDQVDSIRRLGIEVDVLFVNGRRTRLNYLLAFPRLWSRLASRKYDLIHAHYLFSGLIARAQWKYPVVLTHHGIEVLKGWQGRLCRRVTPMFDEVIVVSQEMKDRLGHPGAHVIPCGVNLSRFRAAPREGARAALGMPKDKKLVLFAGEYWRPEKRFDLVQEAVWRLQQEDRAVELVTLSGKTHNEVPTYMNACDVLALASDGEGSPMVVKEAMACRLPVVSVPVGDVPQVIGGTEGCYLCAQEPEDIAAKLKLALAGHSRTRPWEAAQQFSLEGVARRVVNVYEEALAKHSISRLVESSGRRP